MRPITGSRPIDLPARRRVRKLEAPKIKRVYTKDGNLHVVLHCFGRDKLVPQHLIRAELIIRHGAKTYVVFLRNKMAQLHQLVIPDRMVDVYALIQIYPVCFSPTLKTATNASSRRS